MILFALACTGASEEELAAPTVEWIEPADGDTVTAGDVSCSVVVNDFELVDIVATHNEGTPTGYVEVSVDGVVAVDSAETTFTLTLDAGAHALDAQLFYDDGDAVTASDRLCDEEEAGCEPVVASISVTAG